MPLQQELQQEEDIRQYIEARLKQQGVGFEREVACGNGIRADLVTADTVIEIKRRLNRGAIYQAYGQGVAYQTLLKKPKLLIIGLAPASESKYQEAQRIAENVRTDSVAVVFIDKDPSWGLIASPGAVKLGSRPASQPISPTISPTTRRTISPTISQTAGKQAGRSVKKATTTRLPFEPVAASIAGDVAEKVAEKVVEKVSEKVVEKVSEKAAEKAAEKATEPDAKPTAVLPPEPPKPSPQSSAPQPPADKPTRAALKDFWILLLIILVFLWIRTYLWRSQFAVPKLADPPPTAPFRPVSPASPAPPVQISPAYPSNQGS